MKSTPVLLAIGFFITHSTLAGQESLTPGSIACNLATINTNNYEAGCQNLVIEPVSTPCKPIQKKTTSPRKRKYFSDREKKYLMEAGETFRIKFKPSKTELVRLLEDLPSTGSIERLYNFYKSRRKEARNGKKSRYFQNEVEKGVATFSTPHSKSQKDTAHQAAPLLDTERSLKLPAGLDMEYEANPFFLLQLRKLLEYPPEYWPPYIRLNILYLQNILKII